VDAQWSPVKHLILGDDPQQRVYQEVVDWFRKVRVFRAQEDERMFVHEPTDADLAMHKSLLQRLMADGEHLVSLILQIGLPEDSKGITSEAVVVEIETLRDTYRGWHEPMRKEERERMMKATFPDVA